MLQHEFQDHPIVHAQLRVHCQAQEAFLMCLVHYISGKTNQINEKKSS